MLYVVCVLFALVGSATGFTAVPNAAPAGRTAVRMGSASMAFHEFSATTIDGAAAPMSAYKGKPVLILNVASL